MDISDRDRVISPSHILSQSPPFPSNVISSPAYISTPNPFLGGKDIPNLQSLELSQLKSKIAQKEFELVSSQTEQKRLLLKVDFLEQKLVSTIQDYEKKLEHLEKSRRFLIESESSLRLHIEELQKPEIITRENITECIEPKISHVICNHSDENSELIEKLYRELDNVTKSWHKSQEERREAVASLEKMTLQYKSLKQSSDEQQTNQSLHDCFTHQLNRIPVLEKEKEQLSNQYHSLIREYETLKEKYSKLEHQLKDPVPTTLEHDITKERIEHLQLVLNRYQCTNLHELVLKWNEMEKRLLSSINESQESKANILQLELQKNDLENELNNINLNHKDLSKKYEELQFEYMVIEKRNKILISDIISCQNTIIQWNSLSESEIMNPIDERLKEWKALIQG